MNRVDVALIPALMLGVLAVILFAALADITTVVLASTDSPPPTPGVTSTARATERPTQPASSAKTSQSSGSCSISDRFPANVRKWCDLIHQYSAPVGLDVNLIAAVMWQESGGNPKAYSKSGAVGLMQVMPRDGLAASFQCQAGPCFANRPNMDQLFDPEFNVSYGVRMLAGLVEKHGTMREALRAYGPMDVGYYYADKVLKIYKDYQ